MRTLLSVFIFFLATSWMLVSCTYNNGDDLFNNGQSTPCDTLKVSFSNTVNPIIQQQCVGCHNNAGASGGVNLATYTNVRVYALNNQLLGSIKHLSGYSPMPKNAAKLSACEIEKIEAWIRQGSLNN